MPIQVQARNRCFLTLLEPEFVKLATNGLNFERVLKQSSPWVYMSCRSSLQIRAAPPKRTVKKDFYKGTYTNNPDYVA